MEHTHVYGVKQNYNDGTLEIKSVEIEKITAKRVYTRSQCHRAGLGRTIDRDEASFTALDAALRYVKYRDRKRSEAARALQQADERLQNAKALVESIESGE